MTAMMMQSAERSKAYAEKIKIKKIVLKKETKLPDRADSIESARVAR